jgi:hypothetical protein
VCSSDLKNFLTKEMYIFYCSDYLKSIQKQKGLFQKTFVGNM